MAQHTTFCRICEAMCGMTADVENDELVRLRPNKDHPISQGFACPKGIAMTEIVNDPDRILHPLRRKAGVPRGRARQEDFERVSWDEALDDIASRLTQIVDEHGGNAVGAYVGNPAYFGYATPMWMQGFLDALGSEHYYGCNSQDTAGRFAANMLMYGSAYTLPVPDLYRTHFLMLVGANPLLSKGALLNAKRLPYTIKAIPKRGGRVVVVDPRRSETAQAFEHIPIRPDTDSWMLLSMLQVIFEEGLEDLSALARQADHRDVDVLRAACAPHTPEATEASTGVPASTVRTLARDLAGAKTAAIYGRCGSNRGSHGTLVAYLLDTLMVVTGNLDRPGGGIFGASPFPKAFTKRSDTLGARRTRVGNFPDVFGMMCSAVLGREMLTPGEGQMKAFFAVAGNPMLSVPDANILARGLEEIELAVTIDLYVTETAQYADYVLPATSFYEREDCNAVTQTFHLTPHLEWTEPVISPRGEARQEWKIIEAIGRRMGLVCSSDARLRLLSKIGLRPKPSQLLDIALRCGPLGDLYGLRRRGLSLKKLKALPEGHVSGEHQRTGQLTKDRRVDLAPPEIMAEIRLMVDRSRAPANEQFPMRLIGLRESKSHNSWMHNSPKLMAGDREQHARLNPRDAAELGVGNGDRIRISSKSGSVEIGIRVTDDLIQGAVAVPQGWGHTGGWRIASRNGGGVNVNVLASGDPEDVERLAGAALLDGIPVRLEAVTAISTHERPATQPG